MPNLTLDALRSMPQTFAFPGWETEPSTGNETVNEPMTPVASPMRAPTRVFTMPDPTIGGYAEEAAPVGRTVDPGFASSFQHVPFQGQGHYDMVPTWNDEQQEGVGTPNKHGVALLAGVLTQLGGYQPPNAAQALPYVAALANRSEYDTTGMSLT